MDRKYSLKALINKASSILYTNFCPKEMQIRLEEQPFFKSKYEDNPIETLEVIKKLMHDLVISQYRMLSMTETLRQLINVNHYENNNLHD